MSTFGLDLSLDRADTNVRRRIEGPKQTVHLRPIPAAAQYPLCHLAAQKRTGKKPPKGVMRLSRRHVRFGGAEEFG
jgi:hypothetical protein